jgi:hypothetical protein
VALISADHTTIPLYVRVIHFEVSRVDPIWGRHLALWPLRRQWGTNRIDGQ